MQTAGDLVRKFYEAAQKKDIASCRQYLSDDLEFVGLFETYHGPDEYLAAFTGLLGITVRLDVKTIIAQENEVAIFFELETTTPAAATTLVAEWHQISGNKIKRVQSAFDGRPFAAMFTGGK